MQDGPAGSLDGRDDSGMVVPDRRADLSGGEVKYLATVYSLDERAGGRLHDVGSEVSGIPDEQCCAGVHTESSRRGGGATVSPESTDDN
jgi:hypothetical protein